MPSVKHDLAALADVIRRVLPARTPISNLEVKEDLGHVSFHWQDKIFAVDRHLQVFEIKGKQLFVTGSSILLQSVLRQKDKHRRVIEAVMEVLSEVQNLVDSKDRKEGGIKLLHSAQSTLQKLIIAKHDKSNLQPSKSARGEPPQLPTANSAAKGKA